MHTIYCSLVIKEEKIHTGRGPGFDSGTVAAIIAEVGWFVRVDTLDVYLVGLSGFLQLG